MNNEAQAPNYGTRMGGECGERGLQGRKAVGQGHKGCRGNLVGGVGEQWGAGGVGGHLDLAMPCQGM